MSEEIKKEENQENLECNCQDTFKSTMIVLVIVSLLMSIASLTLSILGFDGSKPGPQAKKVVISKQFDKGQSYKKAKETGKPMLVFFYTDWCGFCQRFAPTYNKISKDSAVKEALAVAYVNCEDPENQDLAKEFGIQGFPTVYVIKKNGEKSLIDNNILFAENATKVVKDNIFKILGN